MSKQDTVAMARRFALADASEAMLEALRDICAASDANDGDSLANAIQAAHAIIADLPA